MIGTSLRLLAVFVASLASAAQADVMAVDFTAKGGWRTDRTTVPSAGRLLLTLNGNGTVAAQLNPVGAGLWYGVGIDSGSGFTFSGMSQGVNSAWGTSFGQFDSGLVCNLGCSGSASWTISRAGGIASVQDLFGGARSDYDA